MAEAGSGSEKVLKALNWQPQKKVSQAAFDEAVKDNMDALGLEPDEAVESAIEEFKMKNADMTDVIMTPEGGNIAQYAQPHELLRGEKMPKPGALQNAISTTRTPDATAVHPVTLAVSRLQEASTNSSDDFDAAAQHLRDLLTVEDASAKQQNLAVSVQGGAVRSLLLILENESLTPAQVLSVVDIMLYALQSVSNRDAFADQTVLQGQQCHGPDIATALLQRHADNSAVVEAVANACALAARECEDSKCKLMEGEFPRVSLQIVAKAQVSMQAAVALLVVLKGLMTHDDLRPPASKAFMHSRILALDKGAIPVFLSALQRGSDDAACLHHIISALQQLCANDEICIKVCQGNGVQLVMEAMQNHFEHAKTVAATCGMLRQLAKSDDVKVLLVSIDGLDAISNVLEHHKQSAKVCTQALGLMATLLLRQPEHCDAAFANDQLMANVVDAMLAHRESPPVMRQACQLVRNLVVRNPDLRQPMLGKGVEPVLRGAKALRECDDVALAALRDLGLDDYNL